MVTALPVRLLYPCAPLFLSRSPLNSWEVLWLICKKYDPSGVALVTWCCQTIPQALLHCHLSYLPNRKHTLSRRHWFLTTSLEGNMEAMYIATPTRTLQHACYMHTEDSIKCSFEWNLANIVIIHFAQQFTGGQPGGYVHSNSWRCSPVCMLHAHHESHWMFICRECHEYCYNATTLVPFLCLPLCFHLLLARNSSV